MNNLLNPQEEVDMKNRFPERWETLQRWNNPQELAREMVQNAFRKAREELAALERANENGDGDTNGE
jgi:hypothetical protein